MTSIDTTTPAPYDMPPRQLPTDGEQLQRVPPHSIEAETVVLGSIILDSTSIDVLVEINQADHFYRPAHQLLYQALVDMRESSKPIDLVTVREELTRLGQLEAVGGIEYVATAELAREPG